MALVFKDGVVSNVRDGVPEVLELLQYSGNLALGTNQSVIAAVTSKRIKLLSLDVFPATGWTSGGFKSDSGGPFLKLLQPGAAIEPIIFPFCPMICETQTGQGLFADSNGASMYVNAIYVVYTP